jgi:hypothetical protein
MLKGMMTMPKFFERMHGEVPRARYAKQDLTNPAVAIYQTAYEQFASHRYE